MESEFLNLEVWDQFNEREAEAVGRSLAGCLPSPWTFDGVEKHSCGDMKRQAAFYRWHDGSRFALIPGGEVILGHDPNRPLGPQLQERKRWLNEVELPEEDADEEEQEWDEEAEELRREYFSWSDFFEWLARLPGPRSVHLQPYLVETQPRRCGDFALIGVPFRSLRFCVMEEGLRLPTSDEWEHACAGGARTVWRWGDVCPDHSPEDDQPHQVHRRPNAFGLSYGYPAGELCAEEGLRRSTDGGTALCGGHGWPCAWLSMASATVYDYYALGWDKPDNPLSNHLLVRRAFSVPPEALD